MTDSKPIELRGHHLKGFADFYLKGCPTRDPMNSGTYDFYRIVLENPEQKIVLIENQPDNICKMCYNINKLKLDCFGEFEVKSYLTDRLAAKLLGFTLGKTYIVKDITKVFADKSKLIRGFSWDINLSELINDHLAMCPIYYYGKSLNSD